MHMGNLSAHVSHKLLTLRGLVYCKKIGGRSTEKFHKLSKPCQPPTQYGKQTLAALAEGKLPYGVNNWPL